MRIGIDCRTILNPGFGEQAGVGHCTYFLVRHLLGLDQKNEYVLFFDERVGESAAREFVGNRPNTTIRFFPFHEYRKLLPFVYSHLLVSSNILREKCDVFHSPSGMLPYSYSAPSVITVHDLAIFRHPEWFPESALERFSSTKILLPRAVKLAKKIIVPSEATARDLRELFRISDLNSSPLMGEETGGGGHPPPTPPIKGGEKIVDKIRVIPHGVAMPMAVEFGGGQVSIEEEMTAEEVKAKYGLGPRYLLFVGTIEPRKNLAALVRAFRKLREQTEFRDVTLALVGAKGWKFKEVFDEIKKTESVRYLGYLPASDKFMLMKHATAFVFPSHYEGFGLSVLEAMSLGTPVITSNISALPEVVGKAGLLVNPDHEEEIMRAMREVLTDESLRARLGEAGRLRAMEFTWIKTAERTLEVYEEVRD